jgi:glycosyltransferase involved in cell wall biosynthesis
LFSGNKDVLLIIKTDEYAPDSLDKENVIIIRDVLPASKMAQLYKSCADNGAYISAHKGEGYGRTVLEALHFGCAIGATGYSGVMDFINAENATIFGYKLINHAIYPKNFYDCYKLPQFASPNAGDIKQFMVDVANNIVKPKPAVIGKHTLKDNCVRLLFRLRSSHDK